MIEFMEYNGQKVTKARAISANDRTDVCLRNALDGWRGKDDTCVTFSNEYTVVTDFCVKFHICFFFFL